jgi:hypothetical protein
VSGNPFLQCKCEGFQDVECFKAVHAGTFINGVCDGAKSAIRTCSKVVLPPGKKIKVKGVDPIHK